MPDASAASPTTASPSTASIAPGPVVLADHTTLRLGGPVRRFLTARTSDALIDAVRAADAAGEPLLVLGGGSNLVVADDGFDGTVVQIASTGVEVESVDACSGASVRVAAGEGWDAVVSRAVAEGWVGIEALSGIPGSTGGTPLQNVGAYGQEVAETIASVRTWDRQVSRVRTLSVADCEFGYRSSRLKVDVFRGAPRFVVLEVTFQLPLGTQSAPVRYAELAASLGVETGERAPLALVREAVLALRRSKGMVLDPADHDTWSAGSFFTNPVLDPADAAGLPDAAPRWPVTGGLVKTSAAWLIENSGFAKGYGLPGPVSLSTKHTLAITNRGTATAADVLALARHLRDGVRTRFGIELSLEPTLVNCAL